MWDALAHAAQRAHAAKASRPQHEQVAAVGGVQQRLDRLALVEAQFGDLVAGS